MHITRTQRYLKNKSLTHTAYTVALKVNAYMGNVFPFKPTHYLRARRLICRLVHGRFRLSADSSVVRKVVTVLIRSDSSVVTISGTGVIDNMGLELESCSIESLRPHTLCLGSIVMEMSEDDDELGSLDTLFIGGNGSRLISSELVGGTMSVGGDGSFLTDKMFIGGAEFLLTTSLVSLMTHGSSPRVDQPLSISLGKFDGIRCG